MTYVIISKDSVIAKVYEHDMIAGRTIVLFTSVNTDDVLSVYKVNGEGLSEKVTEVYMLDFFRELMPVN
jgi:hypothetical protein